MAMAIKTTQELWGEDARSLIEEVERYVKLSIPKLTDAQCKVVSTMWDSVKNTLSPHVRIKTMKNSSVVE